MSDYAAMTMGGALAEAVRAAVAAERARREAAEAERARCAAVCRAVAAALNDDTALACAEAIERGEAGR